MMIEKPDLLAIKQEYFERVKPLADTHNPYTLWGITVIQRGCKHVFDDLAARYELTFEQLQQLLRGHRKEQV